LTDLYNSTFVERVSASFPGSGCTVVNISDS